MTGFALVDLRRVLTPHVHPGKSRVETLCLLVIGRISARTVNLTHIAAERLVRAKVASTCRLQRVLQQVILPDDWSVGIGMALTGNPDRCYPCLDRTNRKIGKSDVDVLVLAVVPERDRVPLMWTFPDHSGNSTTQQRISLMQRSLARFNASTVRMLLADPEFIGQEGFKFLVQISQGQEHSIRDPRDGRPTRCR